MNAISSLSEKQLSTLLLLFFTLRSALLGLDVGMIAIG